MSKSIDYHQGYIDALIDMEKELPKEFSFSFKDVIKKHDEEIGKILDQMYKDFHKEKS